MDEEPAFEIEDVSDYQQVITDIEAVIFRIRLLRIHIALYLLLTEVSPKEETSDS